MARCANRWSVCLILVCLTGCDEEPAAPIAQPPVVLEGVLETAHDSLISGWAWHKDRPDDPVDVELFDGQTSLMTVRADGFRKDLLDAKIGNGKHRFEVATPASLKDGKAHEIHARIAETSVELKDSPKQYQFKGTTSTPAQ